MSDLTWASTIHYRAREWAGLVFPGLGGLNNPPFRATSPTSLASWTGMEPVREVLWGLNVADFRQWPLNALEDFT